MAKYTLRVSHDCGMTYELDMASDDLNKLVERGKMHDKNWKRWYIEDGKGIMIKPICRIYSDILDCVTRG